MYSEIPKYPEEVMQFIKQTQQHKLQTYYGPLFKQHLSQIFPSQTDFLNYISNSLEKEFGNDSDERYEIEAQLLNSAIEIVPNVTEFEFLQHKAILNTTETTYRKVAPEKFLAKIPYNTTLYSLAPDAEIVNDESLDKSVIFFHSELFSANLMYCKLVIKLIAAPIGIGTPESYASFRVKNDDETLKTVSFNAINFYQYYLANTSDEIPGYDLDSVQENVMLGLFLDSIMLYIYSHECGHEYLQHFQNNETKTREEIWKDEYQADRFAMQIMGEYSTKMNKEILSLIAPVLFFRYRILLERSCPSLGALESHPPTISRLDQYIEWLRRVIHPRDRESLEIFLSFEEELNNLVTALFKKIQYVASKLD